MKPTQLVAALIVFLATLMSLTSTAQTFTSQQAERGAELYFSSCVECHGANLLGGEAGPALAGSSFWNKWQGQSAAALLQITSSTMPVNNPGSFAPSDYAALVAYILRQNGVAPHEKLTLASSAVDLVSITLSQPTEPLSPLPFVSGPQGEARRIDSEWLSYHGDGSSQHYSSLDLINKNNVDKLSIAWRWYAANHGPQPEFNYEATPLMVDGILYTTAGRRRDVVAIDPVTGENLWMFRFDEGNRRGPRVNSGRGLALWKQGDQQRLLMITPGFQMISLDTQTHQLDSSFGTDGVVDLRQKLENRFPVDLESIPVGSTSPPTVVGNIVVVGATFPSGGSPSSPQMPAGNIRGYDVRTGELIWTFHTIPQGNEFGTETWRNGSNSYSGNAGSWSTFSADIERGIVYIPVEAATGDMYGGHRPGDNLFSQSLVALDAASGSRLWHFQLVHHDVWDYDPPTGPILAELNVNGQHIPAAIQITKQGLIYTFNRVTGDPVWPIEERTVPQNGVAGEQLSATQPFPTLPAAFERLGITEDDLIDFTPELRAEAIEILKNYTYGPLFTPPSLVTETNYGTIFMPGFGGGANWQGATLDPVTNIIYIPSTSHPMRIGLARNDDTSEFDYSMSTRSFVMEGPRGLPLIKPPYGRITAINMNTGEQIWMMANADTPREIKEHPALSGVEVPRRTGHGDRGALLTTQSLLFAGEGAGLYGGQTGGGRIFRAHDKETGAILAELELPAKQTGLPMTYAINGIQYIVVPVGDAGHPGELVALRVIE